MAKTLLVGYRAADLTSALLAGDVTCHTLDVYHRHAIEKVHHAKAICSPHLPEGPWDVVKFRTGPRLMSGELALDLLQECAALVGGDLKPPRFVLDYVGRERDRNDLLDKVRKDAKRHRSFRAEWPASVPDGPKLTFASYPGCFCHRRLDEGGLALAEVVCGEVEKWRRGGGEKVEKVEVEVRGGERKVKTPFSTSTSSLDLDHTSTSSLHLGHLNLLDMGCGCGLVGLLVASSTASHAPAANSPIRQFANSLISLTLVDSHSRAVEAARENAARFGIPAEVILSDSGTPARMDGTFDVFVGNPPYYSDYRIAEVFLETAVRALKPGGVCYQVVKNAANLEPVQARFFPTVEVIRRRGYAILKSVKRSNDQTACGRIGDAPLPVCIGDAPLPERSWSCRH